MDVRIGVAVLSEERGRALVRGGSYAVCLGLEHAAFAQNIDLADCRFQMQACRALADGKPRALAVFMKSGTAYKAAVYQHSSPASGFLERPGQMCSVLRAFLVPYSDRPALFFIASQSATHLPPAEQFAVVAVCENGGLKGAMESKWRYGAAIRGGGVFIRERKTPSMHLNAHD